MTAFDRANEEIESRPWVRRAFRDILALGRWVTPVLGGFGALVLGGYLLTADPATPVAPATAPVSGLQTAPSEPLPTPLAFSNTAIGPHSSVAHDESEPSMLDLLKAVFGAAVALASAMLGMWLGMRRARSLTPVDESTYEDRATTYPGAGNAFDPPRGPTCQRMYDETRLVPQYLRRAEFPAARQDLLRLAAVYPDEGRALRRLQQLPDRRCSSLHDLITEIRID